ncbi:2-hydroxyacid dehydrogenase [Achromobacter denitrificans]|uniref:Glyoxylate/hydroxypyruvate reductase A n=1 Tax=Achromobacter denitrificans TaxID=32002 RepID=A0ABZ3G1F2_ACHDE|nr:glyoxylate/hydroxypyruvate reductase A [Achromobacter denitrificans]OLU07212.1 glyoxylate/hydroxypyruvate reductase A [Achromobacter denitrificans]QCS66836.1 glyoxylate/hydroxypyruvate reductase A [Achromobacter denitrificans]QKH46050.1 glyoxylate/hydroxypyruvate reductase A [Achromobacter denitrificans]QKH53708.1 glyoxylate/hydroxypyruvate reductase A [Achromobacter denitrificans]
MHILFACPHHDPDAWVPRLEAAMPGCRISVWDPEGPPSGADVALVWRPPAELFKHETGLKTLFNLGAGVDALLKMPEIPSHVRIVRLEDAGMAVQMAEYALYALLRVSRDFEAFDHAQARQHWDTREGTRPADWPVGVLGLGQVGLRVAQILAGFGYPVAGWSRSPRDIPGVESFAGEAALPAFLARTRFLVNVLPLTPDTVGILNRDTLSQLLPDAHLVNVGRGEHLVEDDLIQMLEEGEIAGATLDVFHTEPLPRDHPFWRDERVHVTPHIAARTLRDESIAQIAGKVAQLLRGEEISGVVERSRGY